MAFYSHKQLHNPLPKSAVLPVRKLEELLGEATPVNPARPVSAGALDARRLIAEAQKKFEQQQQEKQMPDLKTAITTALAEANKRKLHETVQQWDDDEKSLSTPSSKTPVQTLDQKTGKKLFTETVGTSRATFNFILNNPYVSTQEAVEQLETQGYNPSSTTSLISQMVRQSLVSRDKNNKLTALVKEYRPLKNASASVKHKELKEKRKYTRRAEVVAKQDTQEVTPHSQPAVLDLRASTRQSNAAGIAALNAPTSAPTLLTAKQVLETLSVKEARALYLELKEMFGG